MPIRNKERNVCERAREGVGGSQKRNHDGGGGAKQTLHY